MFGWLGRKSAPEVRPYVPEWLAGEADGGDFVRGYRARLDEVYRRNPVGLRSVRLVAGLTGSLPLFTDTGDPKAVELVQAGGLMEQLAAAVLLHGNAYVRLVADGQDRPAELFAMRPDRTSIASGADGWPAAYLYRGGGQVARIARVDALGRRQVAHLKSLNPGDDHRGLAMAIFEDLELSEFGNRIPMMTFETDADEAPISIAGIVADASGDLIELGEGRAIIGYAAHGSSIADSIRSLVEHEGSPLAEREGKLCGPAPSEPVQLGVRELGCDADGSAQPRVERLRMSDSSLPSSQCLTYHDADRDFQAGQMRASSGGGGAVEERIEVPAVLDAAEAKQWVEQRLARKWQAANSVRLRLPPPRMGLKPGDRIGLPGSTRSMVVRSAEIVGMAVVIEAEPSAAQVAELPADPGRAVPDADEPIGRTELALFELPAMGSQSEAGPKLFAAASSPGRWKPVPVELWMEQQPLPGLALGRRAVLGTAMTTLDPRMPLTLDLLSSVTVRLVNQGQLLLNADTEALTAGANLAIVGEELVQFARAERLEPGFYRLSRLLRGRWGTEWAGPTHCVGERFCLVDSAAAAAIALPPGTTGAIVRAVSHGIADLAPHPEARREISGEAARPPSICHLRAWRDGGSIRLGWVRRSQGGWSWNDGVGVAADPFPEAYRVRVTGPAGNLTLQCDRPEAIFDSASLPGQPGETVAIEIRTVGPTALSRPRSLSLIL